ncbi:MAG TPA: hypothetical protein VGK67_28910 [Myxococcales bacterium]|jgi:tetratricopeptide (TPR) repeat protein
MTAPDLSSLRAEAARLLAAGEPQKAFAAFRPALEYPCSLTASADWAAALSTFADLAKGLGGAAIAEKCAAAAGAPDDVDKLFAAAYELYEQSQYGSAAALLARADALDPGKPKIVNELVSNLEALMLSAEACKVLRASGVVDRDPLSAYLLGFNSAMAGDLATTRSLLPGLRAGVKNPQLGFMVDSLEGILARADALQGASKLDDRDLRGWHFVLNGALLLHLSPHGLAEPMRGRYAYVSDSYGLIHEGLERAGAALKAAGIALASVTSPPGRSHEIVAAAAAQLLGVPRVAWEERAAKTPCLVAAYDLDALGDLELMKVLRDHAPGQILWAHASCWTNPFPFAPDLTTFLYQTNAAPWAEGRLQVDPDTKKLRPSAADEAPIEDLAKRIVEAKAPPDSLADTGALEELARAAAKISGPHAPGFARTEGQRLRQRAGSPVPSAWFR